jgi:hypothetical protein
MQVVHEAGHVMTAWATRGTVTAVVLHPLAISRTDVSPNPEPLAVVWGGPVVGSFLPLIAWLLATKLRLSSVYLWRFFAGFCLVANGVYIGYGVFEPVGDASDLFRLGIPRWMLAAFGLAAIPAGFGLWHGQGRHFGFGEAGAHISARHVAEVLVLLSLVIASELLWSGLTGFR